MIEEKLLAVCLSLMLLLQAWLIGLRSGSFACPPAIFNFFLFLYSFFPLIALPSVPVNPAAIVYFLLAGLSFSLTAIVVKPVPIQEVFSARKVPTKFDTPLLVGFFWVFSATTVASTLINWSIQGLTFEAIFFDLLNTTASYLDSKYGGRLVSNPFATVAIVLVYPMVALGGLIFGARIGRKGRLPIFIASFFPALMFIVVEGNKGTLPGVIVIFLGSILSVRLINGQPVVLHLKQFRALMLYGVLLAPIILVAFLARGLSGIDDLELIFSLIRNMFSSYFFGHLYAFSDWLTFYTGGASHLSYSSTPALGGFYTLMPIYEIFARGPEIPAGIYSEYFSYEAGAISFETNIFTMFRGLILDFGLFGGLIVLGVFGLIATAAFWRLLSAARSPVAVAIFIHAAWFSYASFGVSLFTWDSSFLSLALLSGLLSLNAALYPIDVAQSDAVE